VLRIDAWSADGRERVLYRGARRFGRGDLVADAMGDADFLHLVYTRAGQVLRSRAVSSADLHAIPWVSGRTLRRFMALIRLELGTGAQNLN